MCLMLRRATSQHILKASFQKRLNLLYELKSPGIDRLTGQEESSAAPVTSVNVTLKSP